MNKLGIRLLRTGVLLAIGVALVAVFLPYPPPSNHGRRGRCLSNLWQLYTLGYAYSAGHKGDWPESSPEGYWLFLSRTNPPYIDEDSLEVLLCPLREPETPVGGCDYRGPRVFWKQLALGDPIAADRPGNHGGDPISVVLKDGSVVEVRPGDPLWKRCEVVLEP